MDIIITKIDECFFRVSTSPEIEADLKKYLSCLMNNYMFHPLYKKHVWDGRISYFNSKEKTIPIGLLNKFIEFCQKYSYVFSIVNYDPTPTISKDEIHSFVDSLFANSEFKLRDYQLEEVEACLLHKRGTVESATGSGKSIVLFSVIRYLLSINKQVLLVVPNVMLVTQMFKDFKDYGWADIEQETTILFSGKEYAKTNLLISTYQTLANKDSGFFTRFGGLIVDECLHPNTTIKLSNGKQKMIKDIRVGELILSRNLETGENEEDVVESWYQNLSRTKDNTFKLIFGDGSELVITGNHNVYAVNGKKRVDELVVGEELISC